MALLSLSSGVQRRVVDARRAVREAEAVSEAFRDQRVKVYGYSDVGTDGRANPVYSGTETYWASMGAPNGREATIAGQANQRVDAVFMFSGEAVIPPDGFLGRLPC